MKVGVFKRMLSTVIKGRMDKVFEGKYYDDEMSEQKMLSLVIRDLGKYFRHYNIGRRKVEGKK